MMNVLFGILVGLLGAVGLVELIAWVTLRMSAKQKKPKCFRIIRLDGGLMKVETQLQFAYTSLQWEHNPSYSSVVLYADALDVTEREMCEQFCRDYGVMLAVGPQALMTILSGENGGLHTAQGVL